MGMFVYTAQLRCLMLIGLILKVVFLFQSFWVITVEITKNKQVPIKLEKKEDC